MSDAPALLGAFLEGYAKDAEPAAQAIRELLADFTPEKARDLVERLPELLPEDPEMAAVLAEAMAGEFAGEADEEEDAEDLANENPYHCPKCGKFSGFNGHCDKCGYTLNEDESQKRAERLIEKAMGGTMLRSINGILYRDEIGQIDLEVGRKGVGKGQDHGNGLSKLRQKHGKDIHELAETLAKGKIMPTTKGTKVGTPYDPDRRALVNGDYVIFLARKGNRRWKIATHYKSASDAAEAEEIKQWLRSGNQSHLQGDAV